MVSATVLGRWPVGTKMGSTTKKMVIHVHEAVAETRAWALRVETPPAAGDQDGVVLGQLSSGGSPSRMRWESAPSCRACARVKRSKTNSLTAPT